MRAVFGGVLVQSFSVLCVYVAHCERRCSFDLIRGVDALLQTSA